jgi:hypothetical protein
MSRRFIIPGTISSLDASTRTFAVDAVLWPKSIDRKNHLLGQRQDVSSVPHWISCIVVVITLHIRFHQGVLAVFWRFEQDDIKSSRTLIKNSEQS